MARLIGADACDIALIPSVSSAAGLVAAQFGPAGPGESIVIGQREYSSNHFPWRQLAGKGYDVRQVPFRNGGLEPDDVAAAGRRRAPGWSPSAACSQRPATGPTSPRSAVWPGRPARSCSSTARSWSGRSRLPDDLRHVDVLVAPDHKFLLNAGRGMGYCYLSPAAQARFTPVNAGWRAGSVPFDSFFGPEMNLSPTASRFDSSISWLAAIGNQAALTIFDDFGPGTIYARNHELTASSGPRSPASGGTRSTCPNRTRARSSASRSATPSHRGFSVPVRQGVICSARDGNLRLAIHFYNHEDDIERLVTTLTSADWRGS